MIVGLVGKKACGKSTAANMLCQQNGFELVKFAAPLKNMLRTIGLSEEEIEGDLKETPSDLLCGRTPRHAMQTLGTEWGRDQIGDNFWVSAWAREAMKFSMVVSDDCRFENEAATISSNGGKLIRIVRPGMVAEDGHVSEAFADTMSVHAEVINDGSMMELYSRIYAEIWK